MVVPEKYTDIVSQAISEYKEEIVLYNDFSALEKTLHEKEYDSFIARGHTEELLKNAGVRVPVISVPIKTIDIYKSVLDASRFGSDMGFLITRNMEEAVSSYCAISGSTIKTVIINDSSDLEEDVQELLQSGCKVLIGGAVIKKYSEKYNFIPIVISSGMEAFTEAIDQAIMITTMIRKNEESREFLNAVVTNNKDAIIGVDSVGGIQFVNAQVGKLLNLDKQQLLGKKITKFTEIDEWYKKPGDLRDEIIYLNGQNVFLSKISIKTDFTRNTVLILRDINEIKKLDGKIMKRLNDSGHFTRYTFKSIIGRSEAIHQTIAMAIKYAQVSSTILITGETGVGKEMFAQSIHAASPRFDKPFVAVNCAAISETLLESELFGYEGSAFTGADRKGKLGFFEIANGGTIFLDEISEMSPALQSRFLRVLQEKEIMRIGGVNQIPVDVRVIVATNRNLRTMMEEGSFRPDLFYRINVLRLKIPPIRERAEDIPLLINHFLDMHAPESSDKRIRFGSAVMQRLQRYEWSGNIREINNFCERISVLYSEDIVDWQELEKFELLTDQAIQEAPSLNQSEESLIERVLDQNNGNLTMAAKQLGISRTTLWRKLKKM